MRLEFHLLHLSLSIAGCLAQDFPQAVELDLIFPRENETYAPIRLFPFVFGIQNAAAALSFELDMSWSLMQDGGEDGRGFSIEASNATGGPFLIIESTRFFNGTQVGEWVLTWSMGIASNCTPGRGGERNNGKFNFEDKFVRFATALGGKLPDILPEETGTCPSKPTAFVIERTVRRRPYGDIGRSDYCPVLRPDPPPGDPCAFPVDEFVASNVTSVMKRVAFCTSAPEPSPNETWPQTVCRGSGWDSGTATHGQTSALLLAVLMMITLLWYC